MEQKIRVQTEAIVEKQLRLMKERKIMNQVFLVQLDLEKETVEILTRPIPIVKYVEVLPT